MACNYFEDDICFTQGTDVLIDYFLYTSQAEISSIVPGNPTIINTFDPHNLVGGEKVIVGDVQNTFILGGIYTPTILSNISFSVPINTLNTRPVGGTVYRPTNITGWEFASQIRDQIYTDPGTPNAVASIAAGSREAVVEGQHSLEEGDEISIAGSGLINVPIVAMFVSDRGTIITLETAALTTATRARITRNSKLIAPFTCTIADALAGRIALTLDRATTAAIKPPVRGTDGTYIFDIKYKSGGSVSLLAKGTVTVEPSATQALIP